MAGFLLPSTIQKRLLRYALSRLELLDTDALDLEHLDISWGTKSTLEFKDVGLRLKKLANVLKLPPKFDLVTARILLLRLTIPVDIYSSPIVVEVDGVVANVRVLSEFDNGNNSPKSPTNHDRKRSGQNGRGRRGSRSENTDAALPTAEDLATSFLQTEPAEEKAELEAAISSQSQMLDASLAYSDDGADEYAIGTGTALSLPSFVSNFLKGIVDRLEVRVHKITLDVDVDMSSENIARQDGSSSTETVTLQLKIGDIGIEGVTFGTVDSLDSDGKHGDATKPTHKDGKRRISLRKLRGQLISDPSLFASLARSSVMSSPDVTHSTLSEAKGDRSMPPPEPPHSPSLTTGENAAVDSNVPAGSPQGSHHGLFSSVIRSDSGRFDDASEDGLSEGAAGSLLHDLEGDPGDSIFDPSAYLDQVTDSQIMEEPDVDDHDLPFAFMGQRSGRLSVIQKRSSLSTPRASVYVPEDVKQSQVYLDSSRLGLDGSQAPSKDGVQSSEVHRYSIVNSQTAGGDTQFLRDPIPAPPIRPDEDDLGDASDNSTPLGEDDLSQSMIFSHEEAESMYMSALSQGSTVVRMPGAWDSSSSGPLDGNLSESSPTLQRSMTDFPDNLEHALQSVASEQRAEPLSKVEEAISTTGAALSTSNSRSGDQTPTLSQSAVLDSLLQDQKLTSKTSTQTSVSSDDYARVAKQLFSLDLVTLYLPSSEPSSTGESENLASKSLSVSNFDGPGTISQSFSPDVPGAFSLRPRGQRENRPALKAEAEKLLSTTVKQNPDSIEIILGRLQVQFDVSVGRLIAKLLSSISDAIVGDKTSSEVPQKSTANSPFAMRFRVDRVSLKFLERLAATSASPNLGEADDLWIKPPSQDILLRTTLKGLEINVDTAQNITRASIILQKFVFGYAKENIVSFDADLRMRASSRDVALATGVDLTVSLRRTPSSGHLKVSTLPVHVSIDLQRLDETFSWFGGLSSVLNMGSSMASNATVTMASPGKLPPRPRGVRFDTPEKIANDPPALQSKVEARLGGFVLDLVGKECTVGMETTAVKIVSREEGIGLAIDKIKVSGPHLNRGVGAVAEPAILAELSVTRVEFVAIPKNDDLDRLLSLITPSKAKYDRDDDILLDTLLRQRRQGSVLRVTVDSFKTRVSKLDDLRYLPELGEEVSRLATVAKYLPEDDRPGLLTLLLVRDVDIHVEVNDILGSFQFRASDIEIAQITFPVLLALSVNSVTIHRNGREEIIGAATDAESREAKNRSPAVMARMIGDEMEPVIKVKFWNLRVEYTVPLLMDLMGLSSMTSTEEIFSNIADSVATIKDPVRTAASNLLVKESGKGDSSRSPDSKAMTIDVGLRDCILALNPLGLPSKVLMIMTESHLLAILPKEGNMSATVEMSKGSLLVIDNVANISSTSGGKARRGSFDGGSSQVADLCSAGFVSVSYISSAKAAIQISNNRDEAEKCINVELRDDLLVIESCADSTQTLIGALNGLKPPVPPSKEVKYRTKVIPVQDLLASLSGDAFGTAEGNYDFDEDFGPGLIGRTDGGADDEEASDLDFDSHYYQEEDSIDHSEDNGDYEESREGSLLFDQFQTQDTNDGVLLESFRGQEQVYVPEELHFQEDHFGTGSAIEGTAHRWNSAKNTYDRSNDNIVRKGPLKVSVRDVHIIWNLFDGYDWQHTRDTISRAVQDVESKAIERRSRNELRPTFDQDIEEEETVIGDFLFNSIYIGIPANRDPRELALAINQELNDNATETESVTTTSLSASPSRQSHAPRIRGKRLRLHRSKHHKITFELKGVNLDLVVFQPGSGETESSVDIRVRDFDIFDHVPTSTWKKFATYMHDAGERESGASQIHLEILNVKPIPELAASEIVLKATVLPLRLHVDQDALDFITRFFEFKDDSAPTSASQGDQPFLQRVEVNSIPVKLDFKPKRVDYAGLRSGHTTEFMNFLVLDEADMVLRHTIIYGISGFDKLGKCLNDIWMPDIKRNQLPGILAGLAPVRSLANVGGGMRDLVVVPMREYRKDGRIVRSISKGAFSFARTTGTELVKLGAKLAVGTQTVLQGAEEFLSKPPTREGPSSTAWEEDELDDEEKKQISLYADQPIGVVQGLRGGYASLERDLLMARDAIIAVPGEVMESGSAQGAARAVLRRAPTVILRPVMGVSKAIGQTLMGATNSLDPQNRRRVEDKYKKH